MRPDSIPARLFNQALSRPEAPAIHVRHEDGRWHATSWSAYAAQVRTAARALLAHGVQAGDRICILGFNRPEWTTLDLAAMAIGAVPAGIYTTCSAPEIGYILNHAEAPLILAEDAGQLAKIEIARGAGLPALRHVVMMRGPAQPGAISWEDFLSRGAEIPEAEVDRHLDALRPEDDATFIYTSGTTGPPKAVRLTHDNLTFTAGMGQQMIHLDPSDRMISYLPLSHIAEQVFSVHGHVSYGYSLYFAQSLEKLREHLPEVRPTVLFGVPRVWEKFHAAISARLAEATGLRKILVGWARGVATRANDLHNRGQQPTGLLAAQYRLARKLVFSKLKERIGMQDLRFGVSGAAPIAAEVLQLFSSLDIIIYEVYGQSEDTGPTSCNVPGRTRYGSVGPAGPGIEVRIGEDGEVLVRGRNVFRGYFKDEAATAEALEGGWLHSGDLGRFDEQGFLHITGRKKEILITSGGKNITPNNIESALKNIPLVSQAVLIGDRRNFLSALITLDPVAAKAWCEARGLSSEAPHLHPGIRAELQKGIDELVNPQFARVEHVRRFTILPRELSIEAEELTPTMKLKRRVIMKVWSDEIEALYAPDAAP